MVAKTTGSPGLRVTWAGVQVVAKRRAWRLLLMGVGVSEACGVPVLPATSARSLLRREAGHR